jgi:hypothetical protein
MLIREVANGSKDALIHALAPPVGSIEVKTLPKLSPVTHNDADAQERASRLTG